MKNNIVIFCLLSINTILISQDKVIKNISDLSEIIYSDSIKSFLSSEERKNYERDYSFLSSRYDESGTIAGYQKAVQKYYESIKTSDKKSFSILESESNLVWDYLGPIGLNTNNSGNPNRGAIGRGWIETISVIDTVTIYAGARNSGLWYTSNAGDSWENISESEPLINGILSILIDPEDSQHILLLTGSQTASSLNAYSNGIFETTNHGVSWTKINTYFSGEDIFNGSHSELQAIKLVCHPLNFEDLYLVTASSLYRRQYETGGWVSVYHSDYWNVANSDLVFDENNPNIFYLGGIVTYKCIINGSYISMQNITELITNPSTDTIMKCLIGINENFPDNIWFYYYDRSGLRHLSKFNGSYEYKRILPYPTFRGYRTMNIYPSALDSGIVYIGDIKIYKYKEISNDYDQISDNNLYSSETVEDVTDYLHADIRHLQVIEVAGEDRIQNLGIQRI